MAVLFIAMNEYNSDNGPSVAHREHIAVGPAGRQLSSHAYQRRLSPGLPSPRLRSADRVTAAVARPPTAADRRSIRAHSSDRGTPGVISAGGHQMAMPRRDQMGIRRGAPRRNRPRGAHPSRRSRYRGPRRPSRDLRPRGPAPRRHTWRQYRARTHVSFYGNVAGV